MPTKTTNKKVTTKKTVAKKAPATKKKVTAVKAAPVAKKVEPVKAVTTPKAAAAVEVAAPKKEKKVYEISSFFYHMVILMVVILYAGLAWFGVVYFNYDVEFYRKGVVRYTCEQKARQMEEFRRKYPRRVHRTIVNKTTKPVPAKVTSQKPVLKCPTPVARKVAFNPEQYAPYTGKGNAVIEGKACFTLDDGSEKCFANANVFINPVTDYSDEWYNRGWAGREFLAKADERAFTFNKMVKTDANGNFKFTELKPGSYYVGAVVCQPKAKDAKSCSMARYASKVTMKNRVKTTLKKVYP